jgi:hypothetical protein
MTNLITFITALLTLVGSGAAVYGGASACYGGFQWLQGDHERGRRHLMGTLVGTGIVLTCAALGTQVAALPH